MLKFKLPCEITWLVSKHCSKLVAKSSASPREVSEVGQQPMLIRISIWSGWSPKLGVVMSNALWVRWKNAKKCPVQGLASATWLHYCKVLTLVYSLLSAIMLYPVKSSTELQGEQGNHCLSHLKNSNTHPVLLLWSCCVFSFLNFSNLIKHNLFKTL